MDFHEKQEKKIMKLNSEILEKDKQIRRLRKKIKVMQKQMKDILEKFQKTESSYSSDELPCAQNMESDCEW